MRAPLVVATAAVFGALSATMPAAFQEGPPVFSAQSELVVLQVTVEDRRTYVTDLTADAFTVREDGVPQTIAFFNQLDAPVDIGVIVDGSGSMQGVRSLVAAAAEGFAGASNPRDEMFALTFNDTVRSLLPETAPF